MNCIVCGASISVDTDGTSKCHNCGAYYSRETMERLFFPLFNAAQSKVAKESDLIESRLIRMKRNEKAVSLLSVSREGPIQRAYCILPDGTCQCLSKSKGFSREEQDILKEVLKWRGIIALATCRDAVFGVKDDGTVVVAEPYKSFKKASAWKDIIAISAGGELVAGLRADGTVVSYIKNSDDTDGLKSVKYWKGIKKISVSYHSYGQFSNMSGLRSNGTIVTTQYGSTGFTHIIDIWDNGLYVAALDDNGHVHLNTSHGIYGEETCQSWDDIISISSGGDYILGLKADGTVVAEGNNNCGQCEVYDWKDIIAVFAGDGVAYGIKEDGTIVATALADHSELEKIKLFDNPDEIGVIDSAKRAERAEIDKKEHEKLIQQKIMEREKMKLKQEKAALVEEYSKLNSIFNKRRRSEIEVSLNEINNKLLSFENPVDLNSPQTQERYNAWRKQFENPVD